jgi:hypothetical protein
VRITPGTFSDCAGMNANDSTAIVMPVISFFILNV